MKDDPDRTTQDPGGYFPDADTAREYGPKTVENDYGQDRLRACLHVLNSSEASQLLQQPVDVLDFGIGDGAFLSHLGLELSTVYGVDTSPYMLQLAEARYSDSFIGLVGSSERLPEVPDDAVDLALCIDVEGYLDAGQLGALYAELGRIIRPGGLLVVQTGNELFDLYALNSGTVDFFARYFSTDIQRLLTLEHTAKWVMAPRRNPLNFAFQLMNAGFHEISQGFSQWHERVPSTLVEFEGLSLLEARLAARNHAFDPNQLPEGDRWKALFQCSMFASLSKNVRTTGQGWSQRGQGV